MHIPRIIAAFVCASFVLWGRAFAAEQCRPFGDPPAQVSHAFLASSFAAHNPVCFSGRVLGPWKDSDGTDRYACIYEPEQHSRDNPLPLLVFLHGSVATADSVKATGLVGEIDKADLGGKKPGFILLAPEGRYASHYYPGVDSNAMGWDNWYRQLSPSGDVTVAGTTYKENVDAAAVDHFIQDEIATGEVDPARIYLTGWSNGAAMALLYALNRQSIAAAAVYSAPDPFGAFNDPCPQTPVPRAPTSNAQVQIFNPRIALMHVRNSCDIGGICPNGNTFALQMRSIGRQPRRCDPRSRWQACHRMRRHLRHQSDGDWRGRHQRNAARNSSIMCNGRRRPITQMFEFMKQHPLAPPGK